MEGNAMRLLHHGEVRWLSGGKVVKRMLQLRQELRVFLAQQRDPMSTKFQHNFCLVKLSYLPTIFQNMNRFIVSLQGKGCDVFQLASEV